MLIENTMPNARQVGTIYLIPGVNKIDDKAWEIEMKKGYKGPVAGLFEDGILNLVSGKITIAMVGKTYKVDVLEEWLEDAKGPLKGAIKKQIAMMLKERKAS